MSTKQHHRRRRRERAIVGISDTILRLSRELETEEDKKERKKLQSLIVYHDDVITRTTVNL